MLSADLHSFWEIPSERSLEASRRNVPKRTVYRALPENYDYMVDYLASIHSHETLPKISSSRKSLYILFRNNFHFKNFYFLRKFYFPAISFLCILLTKWEYIKYLFFFFKIPSFYRAEYEMREEDAAIQRDSSEKMMSLCPPLFSHLTRVKCMYFSFPV